MCVRRFVLTSMKLCLKMHYLLNPLLTGRIWLVIIMIIYVWTIETWLRLTKIHEYEFLLNSVKHTLWTVIMEWIWIEW